MLQHCSLSWHPCWAGSRPRAAEPTWRGHGTHSLAKVEGPLKDQGLVWGKSGPDLCVLGHDLTLPLPPLLDFRKQRESCCHNAPASASGSLPSLRSSPHAVAHSFLSPYSVGCRPQCFLQRSSIKPHLCCRAGTIIVPFFSLGNCRALYRQGQSSATSDLVQPVPFDTWETSSPARAVACWR